jgi:large repetitive protein
MSSWGKAHASASNKPKFAPVDENAPDNRGDIYATNQGWVRAAGTIGSGNDNPNAQPEVLVAIGGLAGTSATTGLRTPTITRTRFVVGTTANTDFTANDANAQIDVEITFDEQVTVTGSPQLTVTNNDASGGGYGNLTLAYISGESTANQLRFRKTSAGIGNTDVLTVSTLALNGGTINDTAAAAAGNTVAATLTYASGVAVSKTVSS